MAGVSRSVGSWPADRQPPPPLPQSAPAGDGRFNHVLAEVRCEPGRSIRSRGRRLGNSMRSPTPVPSAHEDRARRGYAKIPSDCVTILASVVPIMTSSRWLLEGDKENNESTADSNRSGPGCVPSAICILPIERPTAGARRSIHGHESVDKLSKRPAARCRIRQTIKLEFAASS
jgi:hypothetical protein